MKNRFVIPWFMMALLLFSLFSLHQNIQIVAHARFELTPTVPIFANATSDFTPVVHIAPLVASKPFHRRTVHRFWAGAADRKVLLSLQSTLCTQINARIILWTPPGNRDRLVKQVMPSIEVHSTDELAHLAEKEANSLRYCASALRTDNGNAVSYSDLARFVILYFYGGIYADMDMVFLKDMRDFHGKAFAFKWDLNVGYYNTAVMGLPSRSPIVPRIIDHFGSTCNPATFWPETVHLALGCGDVCEEFIMMPTALFGPVSAPVGNYQWQNKPQWSEKLHKSTDWFFNSPRAWGLDNFFPGAYTFHWHNHWGVTDIHPDSFFADLERKFSQCNSTSSTRRKVFVDLGGYTGDTMMLYGKKQKWDAIYVFEIDPTKVHAILARLRSEPDLQRITRVLNVAAWNEDTVLQVTLTGHNDGRVGAGHPLLAYDIGEWFRREVDGDDVLLKIDIEGAEVEVLDSLNRAGVLAGLNHLIVEWHDWLMPSVAAAKDRLVAMLHGHGLEFRFATLDDKLDVRYFPGQPWPVNHCDSHYGRTEL